MIFADLGNGAWTAVQVKHQDLGADIREQALAPEDRSTLVPFVKSPAPFPSSPKDPISHVPAVAKTVTISTSSSATEPAPVPQAPVQPFIKETVKDVKWIVVGGVAIAGLLGLAILLK